MTARTSEAGDEMRAGPRGGEEMAGMVSSISPYVRRRDDWGSGSHVPGLYVKLKLPEREGESDI